MAVIVSVQVYRSQIARDYQVGGQGYRWLDKVRLAMHSAAVANCPMRSGELKASHRSEMRGLNQFACIGTVFNFSEHAEWVHEGTTGPIFPEGGPWLYLPAGNGYKRKRLRSVSGQHANPWIDEACQSVARGFGAV